MLQDSLGSVASNGSVNLESCVPLSGLYFTQRFGLLSFLLEHYGTAGGKFVQAPMCPLTTTFRALDALGTEMQ